MMKLWCSKDTKAYFRRHLYADFLEHSTVSNTMSVTL